MNELKDGFEKLAKRHDRLSAPAPAPAAEGQRAERPALIYAKPRKNAERVWMWRAGTMWFPLQGSYNRVSRELFDVDYASSTKEAIRLYDADLTSRGDAAQPERKE